MTVKRDGVTFVDNGGGSGTDVNISEVGGVPVTSPLPVTFVPSGLPQEVDLIAVDGVPVSLGQKLAAASIPVVLPAATVVPISATSLPLPTGASTAALQTQPGVDIGDVTVNNGAGAAAVNIQDGGNTITVDGTVTVTPSGTQDVNLTKVGGAAVALGQAVAASSIPVVLPSATNVPVTGPLTDVQLRATPVPISATNLDVALSTRLAEATFTTRINTQGQKAMAASTPVVIASDQTAVPVSGTVTITPSGLQNVQGNIAHDSPVSTNQPVSVSAVAQDMDDTAPPNRVSAEADVTRVSSDRDGAIFSHPHGPQIWSYHEDSSSALTDAVVHASPGSGLSLYVTDIVVSTGAATALNVFFEEGSTKVLGPYYLEAVNGRGVALHFQTPKKITAATALTVTTSAAIAHSVDVTGFVAPG